jgi:hypothetical protein
MVIDVGMSSIWQQCLHFASRADTTSRMPWERPVVLLTDFGPGVYAGQMRGALLKGGVRLIFDLTHDVPPQDVLAGAVLLHDSAPHFPPETIFVAVVDPGVGTARRPLVVSANEQAFIGPDNGLLAWAAEQGVAFELDIPAEARLSATFHGRDVFAPAAARLAVARDFDVGLLARDAKAPVRDYVRLAILRARHTETGVAGEVLYADAFGNLVTTIRAEDLPANASSVEACGVGMPLVRTYGDVDPGALLGCVGSVGRLEIAVREGSAERTLGARRGDPVLVC